MAKQNKPSSEQAARPSSYAEVLEIMKDYCHQKGYKFSQAQLDYIAQDCYLFFESRGWQGIKYWPAAAMRWVLNNLNKQLKNNYKSKIQKGKSVKDMILEQEVKND